MDESFLFNDAIIRASRNFVCIRAATYEDEVEAKFLKTIFVGREGELDNTVFVIMSPDTKTFLCKSGRSPNFAYRTPRQMAAAMDELAVEFPAKERSVDTALRLPELKNFRLGLNVGSCDGLPLVVAVGADEAETKSMKAILAPLAFSEALSGKFVYATTGDVNDLAEIKGYESQRGFMLIQPDSYGIEGDLVEAFPADVSAEVISEKLAAYAKKTNRVSKNHRQHVRFGNQSGKKWETEIPVTDPDSIQAMQRGE